MREMAIDAYDRMVGLELSELAVDCCVTKARPAEEREVGQEPGGQRDRRGQAFSSRRRQGYTARVGDRPGQPPRLLVASGPHPRRRLGARPGGGGRDRPPRSRLRLEAHPAEPARARARRGDLPEGQACTLERHQALGHRERINSWQNAHRKLLWCTKRRGRVVWTSGWPCLRKSYHREEARLRGLGPLQPISHTNPDDRDLLAEPLAVVCWDGISGSESLGLCFVDRRKCA